MTKQYYILYTTALCKPCSLKFNKICDVGANYFAEALKTNSTLSVLEYDIISTCYIGYFFHVLIIQAWK